MVRYILLLIMIIPFAIATDIYQNNDTMTLQIMCSHDGAMCSNTATGNMTLFNDFHEIIIDNQAMNISNSIYTYMLPSNMTPGNYQAIIFGCDLNECAQTVYDFRIDRSYDDISFFSKNDNYSILWIVLVILLVCIVISMMFRIAFLGILAGFGLIMFGTSLFYLSSMLGIVIIGLGMILDAYFAFIMKS